MRNNSPPTTLHIKLLSDTTFGRGEGTAGEVDTEVEYDEWGLPFIGGKTIRGLLRDSWFSMCGEFAGLACAAERVLGRSRNLSEDCKLRIGDAHLAEAIRNIVRAAVERKDNPLSPKVILASCTSIRYQTAEDRETGAPAETTLRSSRVVLKDFVFQSPLTWLNGYKPAADDLQVLALSALATRHGGLLRNRGRGHICMAFGEDCFENKLSRTREYAGSVSLGSTA